jgi:hypothetical protein
LKATTRYKVSDSPASHRDTTGHPSPAQVQAARLVIEANRKLGRPSSDELLQIAAGKSPTKHVSPQAPERKAPKERAPDPTAAASGDLRDAPEAALRTQLPANENIELTHHSHYRGLKVVKLHGVLEDVIEYVIDDADDTGDSGEDDTILLSVDSADSDRKLDEADTEPAPEGGLLSVGEVLGLSTRPGGTRVAHAGE